MAASTAASRATWTRRWRRSARTATDNGSRWSRRWSAAAVYHGYKDPAAQPSLHYTIVESIEFLEPLPTWPKPGHRAPMTDYHAIMARIDARRWVEVHGVKEIWLWGYHGGKSSTCGNRTWRGRGATSATATATRTTCPSSTSTYTVYHYNYGRGPSEAVEDHMHQIEAVLRHIDPDLFWNKFVGKPGEGRCGWAHYPPNGVRDYDWRNRTVVMSDIEDWRPDGGGEKLPHQLRPLAGRQPALVHLLDAEVCPAPDNGLTYRGRPLTNWWRFIGDFDGAMRARLGLVE
jgi:hypothetical protein